MIKNFLKVLAIILLIGMIAFDVLFFTELKKSEGNPVKAAVRNNKKCC